MLNFLKIILYFPLVNILALLVSVIPGGDVGVAVIILTILVKLALYPFSQHSIENQVKMSLLAPELNKIKESGASKEEQARLTFELYKKHKTNPFSGCLVQIPIIFILIALYSVFRTGLNFDSNILYSFIHVPAHINMNFLGFIDLSKTGSILLALLAGVSQYFQAYFMPKPIPSNNKTSNFSDSLNQSMNMQMRYFLPILIAVFGYSFSGAVALYWITSNIFGIGQQIKANRKKVSIVVHGHKLEAGGEKE